MRPSLWILLAALAIPGCGGSAPAIKDQADASKPLSVTEYAAMVERGDAFLVDVREENEIRNGMAEPAIWMPTSLIRQEDEAWRKMIDRFKEEPEKLVIVYCATGVRSGSVAQALDNLSIQSYNLGGFQAWVDAGLPTMHPDDPIPGQ